MYPHYNYYIFLYLQSQCNIKANTLSTPIIIYLSTYQSIYLSTISIYHMPMIGSEIFYKTVVRSQLWPRDTIFSSFFALRQNNLMHILYCIYNLLASVFFSPIVSMAV